MNYIKKFNEGIVSKEKSSVNVDYLISYFIHGIIKENGLDIQKVNYPYDGNEKELLLSIKVIGKSNFENIKNTETYNKIYKILNLGRKTISIESFQFSISPIGDIWGVKIIW